MKMMQRDPAAASSSTNQSQNKDQRLRTGSGLRPAATGHSLRTSNHPDSEEIVFRHTRNGVDEAEVLLTGRHTASLRDEFPVGLGMQEINKRKDEDAGGLKGILSKRRKEI